MSPMACFVVDLQTCNCQTLCVVGRFYSYREYFHKYEIGSMQSSSQWVVCLGEEEDILVLERNSTNIHHCTPADMANFCLSVLSGSLTNELCVSSVAV